MQGTKIKNLKVAVLDMFIAKRKLKQSKREKVDVITADIGRSLIPDSIQVPKDSDSDGDDDGYDDDVVVQEIGSDIDDRGDFNEVYDKIEDEGEAVVKEGEEEEEEEKREEESITTLLHTTRSGRIYRTWKGRASALDFS